jgi:hypothetical protein
LELLSLLKAWSAISEKTVTYDFARLMVDANEVGSSALAMR